MKINTCRICKSVNMQLIYKGLTDETFSSKLGTDIYKCNDNSCGHLSIQKSYTQKEYQEIYSNYYTHPLNFKNKQKSFTFRMYMHLKVFFAIGMGLKKTSNLQKYSSFFVLRLMLIPVPWLISYLKSNTFFLSNRTNSKVCEIGCGDGENLKLFETFGFETYAIDFDKNAVETAKSNGIKAVIGTDSSIEEFNTKFDVIVLRHVIEHIEDVGRSINHLKKYLNNGGQLILITPNAMSLGHKLFKENWRGLEPPRHINIFTLESLSKLLVSNDMTIEQGFTYPSLGYSIINQSFKIREARLGNRLPLPLRMLLSFFLAYYFYFYHYYKNDSGEELVVFATEGLK